MCVCFCQGFGEKRSSVGQLWSEHISEDCHLITSEGPAGEKLPHSTKKGWDHAAYMGICADSSAMQCLHNECLI